jgi:ATP-dependent Clp protease adaptor protein ClpS
MNRSGSGSPTEPISEIEEATEPRLESLYHVIILNDDEHSYEYVIEMLQSAVGLSQAEAVARTVEADTTGSSIVVTCSLEDAEDKRDRIHSFGPDPRMPQSRGSITALVEPAAC